eukprot:COSAG01_NODE_286_length_19421_cov_123.895663_16_plen_157_part_00
MLYIKCVCVCVCMCDVWSSERPSSLRATCTFVGVIKVTKIQTAYRKWRQYRKNAVQSGLPISRKIDRNEESRFKVESESGELIKPSIGLMREFVRGAIADDRVNVSLAVRALAVAARTTLSLINACKGLKVWGVVAGCFAQTLQLHPWRRCEDQQV